MTQVKESSTQNANRKTAIISCPVSYLMDKIRGHWKPIILFQIMNGPKRYSEIKRAIPDITEKMLIQHLKQLQEANLVTREASAVVPPVVYYSLTSSGNKLSPVLNAMAQWAFEDMKTSRRLSKRG